MNSEIKSFRVKYDFAARTAKELTVKKGDSVLLLDSDPSSSWVRCQSVTGKVGAVPREFVVPDEHAVVNQRARASFDYVPAPGRTGHLKLAKNDELLILARLTADWWRGRLIGAAAAAADGSDPNSREGLFPASYVVTESRSVDLPPGQKLDLRVRITVKQKQFVGELAFLPTESVSTVASKVANIAKLPADGTYTLLSPDALLFFRPSDSLQASGLAPKDLVELVDATPLQLAAASALAKSPRPAVSDGASSPAATGPTPRVPSPAARKSSKGNSLRASSSSSAYPPKSSSGSSRAAATAAPKTARTSRRQQSKPVQQQPPPSDPKSPLATQSSESVSESRGADPSDSSSSSTAATGSGAVTWRGPSRVTASGGAPPPPLTARASPAAAQSAKGELDSGIKAKVSAALAAGPKPPGSSSKSKSGESARSMPRGDAGELSDGEDAAAEDEFVNFVDDNGRPADLHNASWLGDQDELADLLSAGWDPNGLDSTGAAPLHYAAFKGHTSLVQALLVAGANVDSRDADQSTPLHHAAYHGHESVVALLAGAGAQVDARDEAGGTSLHNAAAKGDEPIVRALLAAGADPDARDSNGAAGCHYAAFGGSVACLQLLLAGGSENGTPVDVNLVDRNRESTLHFAARRGHLDCVQLLIERGANVNLQSLKKATPLHAASVHGHAAVVDALLRADADFSVADLAGATAVHRAAWCGDAATLRLLLDAGAPVDILDLAGKSPLHNAAYGGHVAACRALLAAGAKLERKDGEGGTALHNAVYNGHVAAADLLLRRGAPVDAQDDRGITPLHYAAFFGQRRLFNLLLRKDANVNIADAQGRTPLHLSAYQGHTLAVQVFLLAGANPDARTTGGLSPLAFAAYAGSLAAVLLLKESGAPLQQTDAKQLTPLHLASVRGATDVASFLMLQEPSLLNAVDQQGRTALHFASRAGHVDCVSLLLENGALLDAASQDGATPLQYARKAARRAMAKGDKSGTAVDRFFKRLRAPDPRVPDDAPVSRRLNALIPERRRGRMREYKVMDLMETRNLFGGDGDGGGGGGGNDSGSGPGGHGTIGGGGSGPGGDGPTGAGLGPVLKIDPSSRGPNAYVYEPMNVDLNSPGEMALLIERNAKSLGVFNSWANILRHLLVVPSDRPQCARFMWQLIELFVHRVVVQKADDDDWSDDSVKIDPDMFAQLHRYPALEEPEVTEFLHTVLEALLLLFPGLKRPAAASGSDDETGKDELLDDDQDGDGLFRQMSPAQRKRKQTETQKSADVSSAVADTGALESRLASMIGDEDDTDSSTAIAELAGADTGLPNDSQVTSPGPSSGAANAPPAPPPPPMPLAPGAPPPPPPPGGGPAKPAGPKLRRFNWVKLPMPKIPGTVFDDGVASSVASVAVAVRALKTVDIGPKTLEKYYYVKKAKALGEGKDKSAAPKQVVDTKRAQTIGILWTRMKLPASDVADAIAQLDESALSLEDVRSLGKCVPTRDECDILRKLVAGGGDAAAKLGTTESIFIELMRVEALEAVLECWLFKREFDSKLADILGGIELVNNAVRELKKSTRLATLMRVVLALGNVLNGGYFGGAGKGFKLQSLLRLRDTKSTDNKSNLLQYLIELLVEYDTGAGAAAAAKLHRLQSKNNDDDNDGDGDAGGGGSGGGKDKGGDDDSLVVRGGVSSFFEELVTVDLGTKERLDHASVGIEDLKRGLESVRNLLKTCSADAPFRPGMEAFEAKAEKRIEMLEKTVTKVRDRFNKASEFFGEDPASDDFVDFTSKFCQLYREEVKALETKRRLERKRNKRARAAMPKAKREAMNDDCDTNIERKMDDESGAMFGSTGGGDGKKVSLAKSRPKLSDDTPSTENSLETEELAKPSIEKSEELPPAPLSKQHSVPSIRLDEVVQDGPPQILASPPSIKKELE